MKKGFGKIIRGLMDQGGIKSAVELADKINDEAKRAGFQKKLVSPSSVSKWLSDETQPKARSLMFLAKALKVSADLILLDEDSPSEHRQSLRNVVKEVAEEEIKKLLKEKKSNLEGELEEFLKSDKIPQEDKESLIRQARNLLKLYEKIE